MLPCSSQKGLTIGNYMGWYTHQLYSVADADIQNIVLQCNTLLYISRDYHVMYNCYISMHRQLECRLVSGKQLQ